MTDQTKEDLLPEVQTELSKEESKQIVVEAKSTGELVPKTLEGQWRLANYYCKSKLLPKQFDTPEKIIVGLQYCYELGIKPITSLPQVAIINGTPSMFGDLPLAIVRGSKQLKSFKETFYAEDGTEVNYKNPKPVFSAVCFAERIDGQTIEEYFTIEDAKKARLLDGNVWSKYTKDMLRYRSRARTLKTLFADILKGISIAEYDYGINPNYMTDEEFRTEASIIAAERKIKPSIEGIKQRCREATGTLFSEEEIVDINKEESINEPK